MIIHTGKCMYRRACPRERAGGGASKSGQLSESEPEQASEEKGVGERESVREGRRDGRREGGREMHTHNHL
jgi:hypothetical protein